MTTSEEEDDEKRTERSRALLPGDPFPWAPAARQDGTNEAGGEEQGTTHSPAEPGDLSSFDIGGGD